MNNITNKSIIALQIPTGIGAEIGGYAGDFGYIARKFSEKYHCIVNPNAVNGGILSAINYDMSYLEGYLFDKFFEGEINILPKKPYETNRIGVIFDKQIPQDMINIHLNTINALKIVQGINISDIEYTDKEVGVEIVIENNISCGNLKNPDTLLRSAEKLIKKGVEAIAVVCFFGEDCEDKNYVQGCGIDPIGGIEAIISHLISKEFEIPCAHAPAFLDVDISTKIENPKVASELISSTYFPCIAQALSVAPKIIKEGGIKNTDVEFLIVPYDAMGSKSVLSCHKKGIKIIAIKNKTALDVTGAKLNISPYAYFGSYEECLKNMS